MKTTVLINKMREGIENMQNQNDAYIRKHGETEKGIKVRQDLARLLELTGMVTMLNENIENHLNEFKEKMLDEKIPSELLESQQKAIREFYLDMKQFNEDYWGFGLTK